VIWSVFARPPAGPSSAPPLGAARLLDARSTLLYLAADPDLFTGIQKAFVAAGSSGAAPPDRASVDGQGLVLVTYPCGMSEQARALRRLPVGADEIHSVVSALWRSRNDSRGASAADSTAAITAEQLVYGAHGDQLMERVLSSRYQLRDVWVATHMAAQCSL
jgi:hypothetical protein